MPQDVPLAADKRCAVRRVFSEEGIIVRIGEILPFLEVGLPVLRVVAEGFDLRIEGGGGSRHERRLRDALGAPEIPKGRMCSLSAEECCV